MKKGNKNDRCCHNIVKLQVWELKSQITKFSKDVNENTLNVAELKAYLELIIKVQGKLDFLKEDYYKIDSEEDFEQTEEVLSQLDDKIQKIERNLKTSINKIQCDYSNRIRNSFTQYSHSINHDQPKKILIKLPKIPLPILVVNLKSEISLKVHLIL